MFDELADNIVSSGAAYPLILLIVLGDAIIPVLPGETAIITGGIFAARDDLSLLGVFLAGAAGAFAGDNLTYWIGRSAGRRIAGRLFRTEKALGRLEWSRKTLEERGATIIVMARFIPGGRTATSFTAGTVGMPWRRYAAAALLGALLWAGFAALLGYIGGQTFEDSIWKPLLASFAFAALFGVIGEALHRRSAAR